VAQKSFSPIYAQGDSADTTLSYLQKGMVKLVVVNDEGKEAVAACGRGRPPKSGLGTGIDCRRYLSPGTTSARPGAVHRPYG
jgi:CRP-like cAMP-binding protein